MIILRNINSEPSLLFSTYLNLRIAGMMRRWYTQGNEKLFYRAILSSEDRVQPGKVMSPGKRNNCGGYHKITIRDKLKDDN